MDESIEVSVEVVDLNQSQANQNANGNESIKPRTTKTHLRVKRGATSRKRNREGQLTSEIQVGNVGTSKQATHTIEVIDVEQVKDKPVVDLTDLNDDPGNVFVDLTRSPDVQPLPHRQSVIRWQLAPRKTRSERNKNTDEITIVQKDSVVDVTPESSAPANETVMTCAICMDDFDQIKQAKRQLTSTTCGHVFCNPCIISSIRSQAKCPTCRKKITKKSLHPLFL